MEKIIEELRAQVAGLEAKLSDLSTRQGKSAGEIKSLNELKATFADEINSLRSEIAAKEAALKKEPEVVGGKPGIFGIDFIDEVLGE